MVLIKTRRVICITTKNQPTELAPHKKRYLSPTSIGSYLRCPRKFYYSKIKKVAEKPSIHLVRGIAVHTAIEQFYKYQADIFELFKNIWEEQTSGNDLKLNSADLEFFYHESLLMLDNFIDDFNKSGGFLGPRSVIEKTLFSKHHHLVARLDKIIHKRGSSLPPLITDFKTSKSMELTPQNRIQMGICALLYEEVYGRRPEVELHFLKFKNGKKRYRISDMLLSEMRHLVTDIHRKTQSEDIEDYPCTCGWCDKNFIKNET